MTDTPPSASPSSPAFATRSALASQARRAQLRRMKIAALALLVAFLCRNVLRYAELNQR